MQDSFPCQCWPFSLTAPEARKKCSFFQNLEREFEKISRSRRTKKKEIKCRLYVMELKTVSFYAAVESSMHSLLSLNARILISNSSFRGLRALWGSPRPTQISDDYPRTDSLWRGVERQWRQLLSIIHRDHACAYGTIVVNSFKNTFSSFGCGWRRIEKFNFRMKKSRVKSKNPFARWKS